MKNLFNKIWKKEEGFTLIELIIVIAILAIIAAIAIPNVLSAVDDSRKTTDISNAKMVADAVATIRAQEDAYSGAAGYINLGNLSDGSAVDTDMPGDFDTDVINHLNGVSPLPKYRGGAITEEAYLAIIDADGSVTVYVTTAAATTATGGVELYPSASSTYTD